MGSSVRAQCDDAAWPRDSDAGYAFLAKRRQLGNGVGRSHSECVGSARPESHLCDPCSFAANFNSQVRQRYCKRSTNAKLLRCRFAPNNEYMVTAAFDGSLRTWSTRNWTALGVHTGHDDKVTCVGTFFRNMFRPSERHIFLFADIAPDSKTLVSCGFDKMLKFWEPEPQWF